MYLMSIVPKNNHTKYGLKTKELLMHHCGWHGNLVTMAVRNVADAYRPKEPPYGISTQYDLRQRSYKVKCN